jgi:dipeptidyl aminopeptidase/acylaminoacyl peptidase
LSPHFEILVFGFWFLGFGFCVLELGAWSFLIFTFSHCFTLFYVFTLIFFMRKTAFLFLLVWVTAAHAQQANKSALTIEKIMRDPKWIGTSPSNPYWSADSKYLLFSWNPDKAVSDSVYYITPHSLKPQKTTYAFRESLLTPNRIRYNEKRSSYLFSDNGDIYLTDVKTGQKRRITQTLETESNPQFAFNDTRIVYTRGGNLYSWDIASGATVQLTNFSGTGSSSGGGGRFNRGNREVEAGNAQEKWLHADALENSEVLQYRREMRQLRDSMRRMIPEEESMRTLNTSGKTLFGTTISPDGRYVTYRLIRPANSARNTIVPNYVTESGFTEEIPARTKVGSGVSSQELYIYDITNDTTWQIKIDSIPGIRDLPDYVKDYPNEKNKKPELRAVQIQNPQWSPQNDLAVIDMRATDNKDRWLLLFDAHTGQTSLLDRQHDDAWIAGPGISSYGGNHTGWIDNHTFWFQSEATGYSHLYTYNVFTREKKALTSGNYEVQEAQLSRDKKYFYITTNEVHPGEKQFYRLPVTGGKAERITTLTGANDVTISPDEKWIAILYSYTNKPWELYIQENKPGGKLQQVTSLAQSDEFKSYPWRDPEIITIKARDGADIYARLYRAENPHPSKPAVIFVHGAGYLQNAHKWWSSYFREYMFNNFLVDNGYTVLDIDYRGSAGYGRDWRTGIYRHMGGKDLDDHVDAAKYLVDQLGIDPKRIGIYGGSYGGFITLMALFTTPDVFAAGAALRPVTDWAHYNHGYTSNILNEPFTDSLAYARSSPINFAQGLKGHLLICHGMVDVNVHFQDAVRLTQKLIELGKNNWELAVYPMEDHGFVEPSSWTDEYKRIYKLFETILKSDHDGDRGFSTN